ncbi:MAG: endonuclease III [Armatimonadota bacterium]|nr:endonuclease III [bacterium]
MSKISRIVELLDEEYGRQEWTYPERVLDELILTILSQNTTAKTCKQAFARLRERFPAWEDVRLARCSDVAEAIKVGGLANQKAPRIKQILEEVYAQQGSLDLEWLADVPDTEAVDYLLKFHGVGRKTAACTLMFALGRPVFPVDTHIHRIAIRVGLIGDVTADQAHDILQVMIAPEDVYSFHINLVTHGRQVCHAHSPECERCVINEECDYFVKRYKTE